MEVLDMREFSGSYYWSNKDNVLSLTFEDQHSYAELASTYGDVTEIIFKYAKFYPLNIISIGKSDTMSTLNFALDSPQKALEKITKEFDQLSIDFKNVNNLYTQLQENYVSLKDSFDILEIQYETAEEKAERLGIIKTYLEQKRDEAVLQTTKAIYQAILDAYFSDINENSNNESTENVKENET